MECIRNEIHGLEICRQEKSHILIKQLFKLMSLSCGINARPQPQLPLIDDFVDYAVLQLRQIKMFTKCRRHSAVTTKCLL